MSEAPSSSSPQPPASSSPPPAASQAFIVGKSFLKQYYEVLATTPENISRFYKPDTSIISHSFQPSVPAEPKVLGATGHEVFQWAAACSDGSGISIDFGSGAIDAQETIAGGILLVVTGQMTLPQGDVDANNADANTPRPFVHTFFLNVALAGKRKNYYVHNDILRFISTPDGSQQQQQQQQEQQQEDVPVEKNSVEEVNDNTSPPPPPPPQDKPVESEAKPVSTTAVAPPVAQAQKVQIAEEKKDVIQGEKEEKAKEVVVVKDVATSKVESKNERKKASADKGKKKEKDTTSKSDKKSSESGSGNGGKDEKKSKKGKARSRSSKKGSRSASPTEGKNGNDNNDGKPKPPGSWASLVAGSGGTANPSPAAAAAASVASQMTESSKGQATASASASVSTAKEEKRSTTSTTTDNNPSTSASNGKESKTTKAVNGSTSTITQRTPEATLLLKNVSDRTKEHEIRSMFEPYAAKVSQNILGITLKASSGFCFVDFDAKFVVDTILKEVEELKKSGVGNKFAMHGKPMDVGRKVPVEKGGGRGHNYRSSSPGHSTFPKPRHHRRNSPRGQREGNRSGRQHANQDKK